MNTKDSKKANNKHKPKMGFHNQNFYRSTKTVLIGELIKFLFLISNSFFIALHNPSLAQDGCPYLFSLLPRFVSMVFLIAVGVQMSISMFLLSECYHKISEDSNLWLNAHIS